ncbi:MAG TPA: PSD1 and planctomycete cytochrome C domain-containing protein [Bryobacteraceae bacterium]|nr:PSD1 and planctomycete cytochrome C domain-containing protein [Bryobacteraceae bacterium]
MLLFLLCSSLALLAQEPVRFNRDIRPIMSDTCFRCHGPDRSSRMANLRLDIREEAIKPNRRGLAPIVPGDPAKSHIIQRIFSDGGNVMPPVSAHKTLTAAQKDTIRRWVAEGAVYEGHWAYEPVRRPAGNASIDSLIRARLAKSGLQPATEADRRTLIRRLSLDLTGIPPAPEEVDRFVNDTAANAYERLVDRLIGSQRYAEKQAMHWLDAVRYADTAGFHGDNPIPAWPYRDYVLQSIHENQPFDQFTREQLAGDLLPNATPKQKTASAYNRILRVSAEGGVQPKEYLAKYGADRVRTTATVWLGSTLGCAECHDHKFDPFTAKDFYAMKAFFADIKETGLVPDRGPKAWGSQLDLATPEQAAKRAGLKKAVDEASAALAKHRGTVEELQKRNAAGELRWEYQRPVAASAIKAKLTIHNDAKIPGTELTGNGLVVASGPNPENETYTITIAPGAGRWAQLGVMAVQDESLPGLGVARGADRLMISEVEAEVQPGGKKLRFATAASGVGFYNLDQNPMNAIDGNPATGWGGSPYHDGMLPFLALRLQEPLATKADTRIVIRLRQDTPYRKATAGRVRIALSPGLAAPIMDPQSKKHAMVDQGLPAAVTAALKKTAIERSEDEAALIARVLDWTGEPNQKQVAALQAAQAKLDAFTFSIPRVLVTEATKPEPTRILARGNFMDETSPVVEPAIPGFLGRLPVEGRASRLDLANWLISKDNPLTARAYVNRQWRIFFGTGLSKVLEDLGSQGEWPVHADVMDYLAAEFMDSGWNRKHLAKLIVMSETYRQASSGTSEQDPENKLLSRQNRMRVDAEIVRDVALSVSGLLTEHFGGPSVRPYQPEGYLAALNFPKRDYSATRGPDQYRRGLYTFWQRTFLHPSLVAFDAASREECTMNRTASNTPLQALVLLNDPSFVEASRVFAQHTLQQSPAKTGEARAGWAFRRALGRAPNAEELGVLAELYQKALRKFDSDPAGAAAMLRVGDAPGLSGANAAELAATMTVTRAVLNLHETITRN